jgi:hypothetical protein
MGMRVLGSSVGIATGYGLDGPGIEFRKATAQEHGCHRGSVRGM